MGYLGQKQAALALNVANVDTPGFEARDVKEPDFAAMVKRRSFASNNAMMLRTHPMHMQAAGNKGNAFPMIDRNEMSEHNPDGNGVNIDTELQKVAFTQAEYTKAVSIYRKNLSLIRTAIGNPNR